MAKCALLLLCLLSIALTLSSAVPVDTSGKPTPTPVPSLKEERIFQGTPTTNPHGHVEEVLSVHQDQQQAGRTQATPTQTRMGRAASTPSKKGRHRGANKILMLVLRCIGKTKATGKASLAYISRIKRQ
ncbi:hypothetical protein AAFF_G00439590 [Aldrovandia affinis]|uniref:Uncharacterized protein n=1 Tax=Aldrovandia affinis TaxID=143900 RepID=A0AAD7WI19_9TELE|nr:hypothetical protein AAFF_G00439590 [Aldrovandia affinis]